jgi:hypothetical protein
MTKSGFQSLEIAVASRVQYPVVLFLRVGTICVWSLHGQSLRLSVERGNINPGECYCLFLQGSYLLTGCNDHRLNGSNGATQRYVT